MPPSLGGLGQKAAARNKKQEAPGGRRVSLVQGSVHQSPYRKVKERQKAEHEETDALQHQTRPRKHAPVGKENEGQSTRNLPSRRSLQRSSTKVTSATRSASKV